MIRMKPYRRKETMSPNGQNKKERVRNQTMLKGRGKRVRSGVYPGRGKGRTAHGRR